MLNNSSSFFDYLKMALSMTKISKETYNNMLCYTFSLGDTYFVVDSEHYLILLEKTDSIQQSSRFDFNDPTLDNLSMPDLENYTLVGISGN